MRMSTLHDPRGYLVSFLALTLYAVVSAQDPPRPAVNDDRGNHTHEAGNVDRGSEFDRLALVTAPASAPDVLTRGYDNLRSGWNKQETRLGHQVVRNGLKQKCQLQVNGGLDAQPLVARSIDTQDGATHDVVVTTSLWNEVAAFDANTCARLWSRLLTRPVTSTKAIDWWLTNDKFGIISTGVIVKNPEQSRVGLLYVVAWSSKTGANADASHLLYEINLFDGSDHRTPLVLSTSLKLADGKTMERKQRAALSYYGGTLFVPWGTVQETADGAHGYITAITLAPAVRPAEWLPTVELNITPQGKGGGIWQAGQGMLIDAEGYLYAMTSNGTYNGTTDFSESFIKVRYALSRLTVIDHYSPFRDSSRSAAYDDQDLGSGGPNCIPELGLCFGAGKDGILYRLPWKKMAAPFAPLWYTFYPGPNIPATKTYDQQFFQRTHHMHGNSVVAYLNEHNAGTSIPEWRSFVWGENGNLRAWKVTAGQFQFLANGQDVASANSPVPPGGMPGAFLTLSSNAQNEAVVWATVPLGDANREITQGYLAAYDANNFDTYADGTGRINQLWRSPTFTYAKFTTAVVWGGMVLVPTYAPNGYDGRVIVYAP